MTRLVAVLGYSDRGDADLHPVCAARLLRAEEHARDDDVVLFSGWARRGRTHAEADTMARAWTGAGRARIVDRDARTTLGNAIGVGRTARRVGADEVVLVTSSWHARRASALVRASLLRSGATLRVSTTDEPATVRQTFRELVSWTIVPMLALVAMRNR
jgi:hypothetical protein